MDRENYTEFVPQPDEPVQEQSWRTCEWDWLEKEELWKTECGEAFVHFDDLPSSWSFKFCPYCGKPISEDAG